MATTIKCPDCGHTKQSDDGEPETCPQCEGTMTAPPKKKYQAKATSLEEEARAKKKAQTRDEDAKPIKKKAAPRDEEDEEDDRPKAKKQPAPPDEDEEEGERPAKKKKAALSLDDDDEEVNLDFPRDGKAAARLEIDTGFGNKSLMRQVARELARGEVLHWAGRPSMEVAKKQGMVMRLVGAGVILLAIILTVVVFAVSSIPKALLVASVVLVLFGVLFIVLGPKTLIRQAERGWYAVTDRRAIVYLANLWGKEGHVDTYEPPALRKMWIKKSFWVKGAGDLIFRTDVHDNRTKWVDRRTGQTVKETGHRTEHHYGFLGIEDVKDVEALVHEVLLDAGRSDDEEEDE